MWNFVLSCPSCNEKKNNRIPTKDYLIRIENRNKILQKSSDIVVSEDFDMYYEGLLDRMWSYAKLSRIKEFIGVQRAI